jgi:hypothetical protein
VRGGGARTTKYGPIYLTIERALYVLGPALLSLLLLSAPSYNASREQAEANTAREIAAESLEYCTKWGMPAGTAEYASCVRDLADIRGRAELRLRAAVASDF